MNNIYNYKSFNESKKVKFPNIKTVDIDGYVVLIGRDAASNDYLSINMADDDDLWFHVKGHPSSHIIVRCRNRLVTPEVKRQVAELTVKNSKSTGNVVVICCKAKYVTKHSDMKPGQVSVDYNNVEEIDIVI